MAARVAPAAKDRTVADYPRADGRLAPHQRQQVGRLPCALLLVRTRLTCHHRYLSIVRQAAGRQQFTVRYCAVLAQLPPISPPCALCQSSVPRSSGWLICAQGVSPKGWDTCRAGLPIRLLSCLRRPSSLQRSCYWHCPAQIARRDHRYPSPRWMLLPHCYTTQPGQAQQRDHRGQLPDLRLLLLPASRLRLPSPGSRGPNFCHSFQFARRERPICTCRTTSDAQPPSALPCTRASLRWSRKPLTNHR
ncbi:hypothetical protein MAA44156_04642 [Mycobacterium avium subsp. avium]|nr:hypothetical protein MAA44156_04642 [Mycobacterium avium subsp. avium]